jgi:hypothetical protein
MKKFLILSVALLVLVSVAFAGYGDYYKVRTSAKVAESQGDIAKASEMYLSAEAEASVLAAQDGMKLPWATYAEWQRNNAAYVYVNDFKVKTDWVAAMEAIKAIPNGPERLAAAEALKSKAAPYVSGLKTALAILNGKEFVKAEVMAKVKSNKEFCVWVLEFVK